MKPKMIALTVVLSLTAVTPAKADMACKFEEIGGSEVMTLTLSHGRTNEEKLYGR